MSTSFPGVSASAVFPTVLTIPADGDPLVAATFDPAVQQLAHNVEFLAAYGAAMIPGGRISVLSNFYDTDSGSGSTLYYLPFRHDMVPIYNGTFFYPRQFSSVSQAASDTTKSPAAATTGNYDLFAWLDGTTIRVTRGPVWTSDSARGTGAGTTELDWSLGRPVNKYAITNGPAAQRGTYLGTVHATGGSFFNATTSRNIWNAYNQIASRLQYTDSTDTWNHPGTGGTWPQAWRQAKGLTTSVMTFVAGLDEGSFTADLNVAVLSNAASNQVAVGIGFDQTSAPAGGAGQIHQTYGGPGHLGMGLNQALCMGAKLQGRHNLGYHTLYWLETATGSATFVGDAGYSNGSVGIAGMTALIMC